MFVQALAILIGFCTIMSPSTAGQVGFTDPEGDVEMETEMGEFPGVGPLYAGSVDVIQVIIEDREDIDPPDLWFTIGLAHPPDNPLTLDWRAHYEIAFNTSWNPQGYSVSATVSGTQWSFNVLNHEKGENTAVSGLVYSSGLTIMAPKSVLGSPLANETAFNFSAETTGVFQGPTTITFTDQARAPSGAVLTFGGPAVNQTGQNETDQAPIETATIPFYPILSVFLLFLLFLIPSRRANVLP